MKIHQHNAGHMTKMAAMSIYGKNTFKILFWLILMNYFMARSNFATWAFIWENVTMMDSLEIIASCDLEFS